jgi:3-dehydroquinate dehydratase
MDVAVLLPAARASELPVLAETVLVPYAAPLDLVVSLRAIAGPAVIVSDGLDAEATEAVAAAVRDHSSPCIEVRSARWDGESFSPLSAACRGVISGFGVAGVAAAVTAARS